MNHLARGGGDIAQLVELCSCNWVVAITGLMSNCPGGNDSIFNEEDDRNMPLKDSTKTNMGWQERRGPSSGISGEEDQAGLANNLMHYLPSTL
ncbi:hypothetical protein DCAR_0519729 [Daucus carota subsp. sativus]|uniref:Uncharacterized protein n=1 Tax=Daucus carota subsp. sativus TaxID=79200 RepID=A0AAF0X3B3_DAUCS|nr:hypothetical protein DCAR_0519729 [Daucus carota subsp. sativus]